jgi:hypothetical protein
LRDVSHKTRIQIEDLLAARFPKADVPNRLVKHRALEPLSDERYSLQLSASRQLKQKLELARDLISHANPSGDLAKVVERALDVLIEKLQSRRFAQAKYPRREAAGVEQSAKGSGENSAVASLAGPARRAHLRHDVRRAVVARDGQRCSFVGKDGHRCEARAFLEVHHQRAWALGGADSLEDLALLCRSHNRLLAEREFGTARVAEAIEQARHRR